MKIDETVSLQALIASRREVKKALEKVKEDILDPTENELTAYQVGFRQGWSAAVEFLKQAEPTEDIVGLLAEAQEFIELDSET